MNRASTCSASIGWCSPGGESSPRDLVGDEGVARGEHRAGIRQRDRLAEVQPRQRVECGIVEVVLEDRPDDMGADQSVVKGTSGAEVDDVARGVLAEDRRDGDRGVDLPRARDENGQFAHVQVRRLLLQRDDEKRAIGGDGSM